MVTYGIVGGKTRVENVVDIIFVTFSPQSEERISFLWFNYIKNILQSVGEMHRQCPLTCIFYLKCDTVSIWMDCIPSMKDPF